ncbi:MAG: acyl-CoA dehydratase activase-related protein [Candidatus Gastranaerophilales bacterium]|nr:acyl-CoA dehydratase activase-related protein [Candidatus Gastranaerophilales bacterium]
MKIGIPRGLSYYNYYPFWHGFFTHLGIEVVVSDKTTKQIVSNGSALVVSETCLPVKVYVGHVLNLLDKGVDVIYSPSIQSIEPKIYNCSKIRGLPDLVRNVIKRNYLLIEPTLDMSEKNQGFYQYLYESVAPLGITDKKLIKAASKSGWESMNRYTKMVKSGMDAEKAMRLAIQGKIELENKEHNTDNKIKIAVISHAYNLFDNQISMKIIQKLNKMGSVVYLAEELEKEQLLQGFHNLDTDIYWANEYEMSGAAGLYLRDKKIDGVITLTSFGCGPDSLMIERITRFAKKYKKPLLNLTVDEHTGEAGFITRLEAFTDMITRTKRASVLKQLKNTIQV